MEAQTRRKLARALKKRQRRKFLVLQGPDEVITPPPVAIVRSFNDSKPRPLCQLPCHGLEYYYLPEDEDWELFVDELLMQKPRWENRSFNMSKHFKPRTKIRSTPYDPTLEGSQVVAWAFRQRDFITKQQVAITKNPGYSYCDGMDDFRTRMTELFFILSMPHSRWPPLRDYYWIVPVSINIKEQCSWLAYSVLQCFENEAFVWWS
jgi:hypothetical protein